MFELFNFSFLFLNLGGVIFWLFDLVTRLLSCLRSYKIIFTYSYYTYMYVFKHMISEYLSISSTDEAVVTAKRLVFIALFTV